MTTGFRYKYSRSLGNVPGFRYKRLPGERRNLAALVVDRERKRGDFVRLIETNRRRKLYWPYEAESPQEVGKMQRTGAEKVSTSKSSSESRKNTSSKGLIPPWMSHFTEPQDHLTLFFVDEEKDDRLIEMEDKLKSKEREDPRLYKNGRKAVKLRFEYYAIRENGENRFYIAPNLEGAEALQKLGVPVSDYTISVKGITFNEPGMFGDTEPIDVLVWPLSLKGKPLEPTEPFVVPASEKTVPEKHASFRNKTAVSHKVKSGGKKSYMALISGTDELYGLNRKFLPTHKDQSTMELKEDFPLGSIIEEDTKLTPRRYFIVTQKGLKLIGEGKEGASLAKRIMRKREK